MSGSRLRNIEMLITERKPLSFLVDIFMSRPDIRRHRLARIRVLFPDLGAKPSVYQMGFLRYPGEQSIVKPQASHGPSFLNTPFIDLQ